MCLACKKVEKNNRIQQNEEETDKHKNGMSWNRKKDIIKNINKTKFGSSNKLIR